MTQDNGMTTKDLSDMTSRDLLIEAKTRIRYDEGGYGSGTGGCSENFSAMLDITRALNSLDQRDRKRRSAEQEKSEGKT